MLTVDDFKYPNEHPVQMLEGYERASEKESVLVWMLAMCIKMGEFCPIQTERTHPTMVSDGLLEQKEPHLYALTEKAKGLLYSVYHKDL